MIWAIVLAGGSGQRMGADKNKVLLPVGGVPAIVRSLQAFVPYVNGTVCVCRPEDEGEIRSLAEQYGIACLLAPAGYDRQASVYNGLQALPDNADMVLVHDGARCLVDGPVIEAVIASVRAHGSGVTALPVKDTIKTADSNGAVIATPDRSTLRAVQTPQGFRAELLRRAHETALQKNLRATDDSALVEALGETVYLTPGSERNLKLTTPQDLILAESLLSKSAPADPCPFRVGSGYDVHKLVEERDLILCGVKVPHTLGLLGHSDADVALHALMDALLGAAGLYDIGRHFPDNDPAYKGISSMKLLHHVMNSLKEKGFAPVNADITIVAQKPKLLPFIEQMNQNVADALNLPREQVNVKATTTEKLGFEGRQEGISAQAVCLIRKM